MANYVIELLTETQLLGNRTAFFSKERIYQTHLGDFKIKSILTRSLEPLQKALELDYLFCNDLVQYKVLFGLKNKGIFQKCN